MLAGDRTQLRWCDAGGGSNAAALGRCWRGWDRGRLWQGRHVLGPGEGDVCGRAGRWAGHGGSGAQAGLAPRAEGSGSRLGSSRLGSEPLRGCSLEPERAQRQLTGIRRRSRGLAPRAFQKNFMSRFEAARVGARARRRAGHGGPAPCAPHACEASARLGPSRAGQA